MSMSRKQKLIIGFPAGIVVLALLLPLSNLIFAPDNSAALPQRSDGVPQWGEVSKAPRPGR
jgi:hypothetical protein